LARRHGSDLLPLKLPYAHRPAVPFLASPVFRKVFTGPASPCVPPATNAPFVSPFGAFRSAVHFREPPEPSAACWRTVAASHPLGDCDSLRPETSPSVLDSIRNGFSSPLVAQFLARVTDGARTPPEELVNPACQQRTSRLAAHRGRANQPAPAFPQSPGIISGMECRALAAAATARRSPFWR
jgi:hypothetical protein